MKELRIAVAGNGRMGQSIAARIAKRTDMHCVGVWARGDDLDALVSAAQVVIDFSLPDGTEKVLDVVAHHTKPLICGVSGLSTSQVEKMSQAATVTPIVHDRNMSLGIAVLIRAVMDAAKSLGDEFRVNIAETHHVHKIDSPSGTALKLAEAVAAARGEADTQSITFDVERRGEVFGDHEVTMHSSTEQLGFSHSVQSRAVFADGALRAASWIVDQAPGLYTMRDVLFGDTQLMPQ